MSKATNISEFIPSYPEITDKNFTYDIARRKEFYELRLDRSEEQPEQAGIPMKHQKMLKRFFSPFTDFKNGLIFHEMGTGKCVHPNTKIITNKGEYSAEEIWEKYYTISKIIVCDNFGEYCPPSSSIEITSLDVDNSRFISRPIKFLFRQKIDEHIITIKLGNNNKITLTKSHKLLCIDSETQKSEWISSLYLVIGDFIAIYSPKYNGNYEYSEIIDIVEEEYSGFVYDLNIDEYHNFVANNIVCHNTCVESMIVENFKNKSPERNQALVFVKNKDLQLDFINKVATQCTKDIYVPKFKEGESTESIWNATKRLIKNQYEFVTYDKFLSKNRNSLRDKNMYSNRVIILDEIQSVSIRPKKKDKRDEIAPEEYEEELERESYDERGIPEKGSRYGNLWHFLHDVENCQIILATGTPIRDQTSEIASQMNLILPIDEQLPVKNEFYVSFFRNGKLTKFGEKTLKDAFRGRISFLRQQTTIARRKEIGVTSPWLKYIKVYPDGMSQFQYEVVKNCSRVDDEDRNSSETLHINSRHASNFVMPFRNEQEFLSDQCRAIFNKVARHKRPGIKDQVRYQIKDQYIKNEIKNNLDIYSTKYASILNILEKNPKEAAFIYNDFVTGSGGVIMFGLILQILGWTWVRSVSQINLPVREGEKGRFMVITGAVSEAPKTTTNKPNDINAMLNRFNQPDNKYGEKCRIVIGSFKISEGFDIKNIRQVHIIMPHWNEPRIQQALGRVLRIGSHKVFEDKEKKYINIYRHVAVKSWDEDEDFGKTEYDQGLGYPSDIGFTNDITDDIEIYLKAQNKEAKNVQIYRLIKEVAWDCPLNYRRNVTGYDEDGSRACDYQECNYVCDNFEPSSKEGRVWEYDIVDSEIIYDTYNLFYAKDEIKDLIGEIVELFGFYFSLTWDMIKEFIEVEDENILLKSLDNIINRRIAIKNRYGFKSYLQEDGNIYFLEGNIESCSSDRFTKIQCGYPDSIYLSMPLVTESMSFDNLVEVSQLRNDQIIVSKFCYNPSKNLLNEMYYKSLIVVLEIAYDLKWKIDHKKIKANPRFNKIISLVYSKLENELYKMADGKTVHIMYISEYTGLGYNISMKDITLDDNIRVYVPSEEHWEDVDDIETKKKYIVQIKNAKKKKGLTTEIRGLIDKTNLFKIINKDHPKGRVCSTFDIDTLIDFVYEFNIELEDNHLSGYNSSQIINLINKIKGFDRYKINLRTKNIGELRQLLVLLSTSKSKKSKEILCGFIQEYLTSIGKVEF